MKDTFLIKKNQEKMFEVVFNGEILFKKWGMPEVFDMIDKIRKEHSELKSCGVFIDPNVFESVYACFISEEEC